MAHALRCGAGIDGGLVVSGKISRLLAASMVPLAGSGADLTPPELRIETPSLEAPAMTPTAAFADPEALTYMSTGNALGAPLGSMRLSPIFAAFEHHQGAMSLEYAGVLPPFPGYRIASEFLSGATVYRVTNAEQYFLDNPTICGGKPLKFIVTKFTSLADVKGGTMAVNLWLSSLDDYNEFGPTIADPCGGDTYKAAKHSEQ